MAERFEVRPLLSNAGEAGWSVFDKVGDHFAGGWYRHEEEAAWDADWRNATPAAHVSASAPKV